MTAAPLEPNVEPTPGPDAKPARRLPDVGPRAPGPLVRLLRDPWLRTAVVLWALLAVAAGVKSFVQPEKHTVYPCFYKSSLAWWSGKSMYVYTGYQYTPTFAIANTPFALCGISAGAALFNAASIALLVTAVMVLARDVLPGRWTNVGVAVLLMLTLAGALRGVWATQSNALVIALVMLGAAAVVRGRWWTAAFLLAAPVFVKIWPLAAVMLIVACWPRKLWWRFLAAAAALAAVPFLAGTPRFVRWQFEQYHAYLDAVRQIRFGGYRDAWTILEQFVEPNAAAFVALQLGAALAALAFCLWRRRRAPTPRHAMTALLCAWVGWQLLFGPGSERLTYGILAPMAGWAVIASFAERRLRGIALAAWLMTTLLGTGAVERALAPYLWWAAAIQPLGVVLFLLWLVARESRRPPLLQQQTADGPDDAGDSASAFTSLRSAA